jgi:DNA-directed RNA polymerase subunit RPC12/RpoP
MLPPLVRRCPDCGYLGLRFRFAAVEDDRVECPVCGHRFAVVDDPSLV